jgi:hypothetical protein
MEVYKGKTKEAIEKIEKEMDRGKQLFKNFLLKKYVQFFEKSFYVSQCDDRVKEGIFINGSLGELRGFIADFIKTDINVEKPLSFPPFFDRCIPYQCNPYFEECFGKELNDSQTLSSVGHIMKEIIYKICSSDEKCDYLKQKFNIVVFNVLNISKKANNPPPTPYTDISGLQFELTRLKSLKQSNYDKVFEQKDTIAPFQISDDVNLTILEEFENRDTIKAYNNQIQIEIKQLIKSIKESNNKGQRINNQESALKELIDYITNINAVTSIGTMEFTDMIAKFGMNKNVCNYIELKEDKDKELLLKGLEPKLKEKLINLSNQQRDLLMKLQKSIFEKSYKK